MKAKTLIVCATAAVALPLSSAWATQPTGPQGTGWLQGALTFAQLDRNGDGVISREEFTAAEQRGNTRGFAYSGHSADTNPPVPAP